VSAAVPLLCDFDDELGANVLQGRRAEFARFQAFRDESAREQIPDPQAEDTFRASQLDWTGLAYPDASATLVRYRELLAVRRRHIAPLLPMLTGAGEYRELATSAVLVRWISSAGAALTLVANLNSEPALSFRPLPVTCSGRRVTSTQPVILAPGRSAGLCSPEAFAMIPRATYRLQLHKDFGFDAVAHCVPYLAALGVSHAYLSPYLKARPGSTHGYDIVDHGQINPELGDELAFGRMNGALRSHGLGQLLDFVPNHMGVGGSDNPLWLDVLEWGADAAHEGWFDIEWDTQRRYLHNKLLVPLLAITMASNWNAARSSSGTTTATAVLPSGPTRRTSCHLTAALRAHSRQRQCRARAARRCLRVAANWHLQMARRAAELKAQLAVLVEERPDVRQALDLRLARFRVARAMAAVGASSMPSYSASTGELPISVRRRMTSTIGAFLTSMIWPACAWSCPKCSITPTSASCDW